MAVEHLVRGLALVVRARDEREEVAQSRLVRDALAGSCSRASAIPGSAASEAAACWRLIAFRLSGISYDCCGPLCFTGMFRLPSTALLEAARLRFAFSFSVSSRRSVAFADSMSALIHPT